MRWCSNGDGGVNVCSRGPRPRFNPVSPKALHVSVFSFSTTPYETPQDCWHNSQLKHLYIYIYDNDIQRPWLSELDVLSLLKSPNPTVSWTLKEQGWEGPPWFTVEGANWWFWSCCILRCCNQSLVVIRTLVLGSKPDSDSIRRRNGRGTRLKVAVFWSGLLACRSDNVQIHTR